MVKKQAQALHLFGDIFERDKTKGWRLLEKKNTWFYLTFATNEIEKYYW